MRSDKEVTTPPGWQHPFVNVFRHFAVDRYKECRTHDVVCVMDKAIGKRVWRLEGAVPVSTYIQLPISRSESLGLIGRFCYIQVLLNKGKEFLIHLDVQDAYNNVHRVTLSNMFKQRTKKRNVRSVQVPLEVGDESYGVWCTLAVDLPALLKSCSQIAFKCLRGFQICANLTVRSIFTSNILSTSETLPKDMVLSMVHSPSEFKMIWIPEMPLQNDVSGVTDLHSERASAKLVSHRKPFLPAISPRKEAINQDSKKEALGCGTVESAKVEDEHDSGPPLLDLCFASAFSGEYTNMLLWVPNSNEIVFAASSLLISMNGALLFQKSKILELTIDKKHQRYFMGHSASVCCLSINDEGTLLASGQEGAQPIIRLWNFQSALCLAVLQGHNSGLACLDLSPDGKRLVGVGLDEHRRQVITIWTLQMNNNDRMTAEITNQVISIANIKCIKWSPFDVDRLFTSGRDNVRMHRIKHNRLRSMPINLTESTNKKRIFTCISFSGHLHNSAQRSVFVGSSFGVIFQIDYESYGVVACHKLQQSAINCLAMSEGFCVVGSDDCFLRVWPLDFGDYLLEAENASPVTTVDLSDDGLKICAGTESGTISLLDIVSHTHETLLRSHTDAVNCVSLLPSCSALQNSNPVFLTGSSDGTMRQWVLTQNAILSNPPLNESDVLEPYLLGNISENTEDSNFQQYGATACCQSYEFRCPTDKVMSIAASHEGKRIAAGFASSWIREFQQFGSAVVNLEFTGDASKLIASNSEGNLVVYDAKNAFRPVKQMCLACDGQACCFAANSDSCTFATASISNSGVSILLYAADALQLKLKITSNARSCSKIMFSADGREIWMLDRAASDVSIFETSSGNCVSHWTNATFTDCSALCLDDRRRFVVTGHSNGVLRIWSYPLLETSNMREIQKFCGHSSEITDLKICGAYMISVGYGDSIFIWKLCETSLDSIFQPLQRSPSIVIQDSVEGWKSETDSGEYQDEILQDNLVATFPVSFRLEAQLLGISTDLRSNFVWHPTTGFFAFVVGCCIVVEDLQTRAHQHLKHHHSPIGALCLSEDGLLLTSASTGVEISGYVDVCIWHTGSLKLVALLQHHVTKIQALAFSFDSTWLVSMTDGAPCSVVVWDVASQTPVAVGHSDHVCTDVLFFKDALDPRFVAISSKQLTLWDLQVDGLHRDEMPSKSCNAESDIACGYADASGKLYLMTSDGQLLIYQNGVLQSRQLQLTDSDVTDMVVCGHSFIFGTQTGQVLVYRSHRDENFERVSCLDVEAEVLCMRWDACCKEGIVSTADASIWYVSLDEISATKLITGPGNHLTCYDIANSTSELIAAVNRNNLRVLDIESGTVRAERSFLETCTCVRISADEHKIACGFEHGTVQVFAADEEATTINDRSSKAHSSAVAAVAFAEDNHSLLSLSQSTNLNPVSLLAALCHRDGFFVIHDTETLQQRMQSKLPTDDQTFSACDISPACDLIALASPHKFKIFSIHPVSSEISQTMDRTFFDSEGKLLEDGSAVVSFGTSDDGCYVLYSSSLIVGRVLFIDLTAKSVSREIQIPDALSPISFISPSLSSKIAFVCTLDGQVYQIDAAQNKAHHILKTQTGVIGISWSDVYKRLYIVHTDHIEMMTADRQF